MTYFVFNPIYKDVVDEGATSTKVIVRNAEKSIELDIALIEGRAKVYLSKVFQKFFDNPKVNRLTYVVLQIGSSVEECTLIWGSADAEQIESFRKTKHIRWFDNMPMDLSIFNGTAFLNFYTATGNAIFTHDSSKDGHFIRWIDNIGNKYTFLMSTGIISKKVSDGESLTQQVTYTNYYLPDCKRVSSKSVVKTLKCAAIDVTKEEFNDYLNTIATSVMVDLLAPNGMWIPINVDPGSFSWNEKDDLIDFEISFVLPTAQPQSL